MDEDCGIPTSVVENYQSESGQLVAASDPRSYLLSMSEYDHHKAYDVYGEYSLSSLVYT